MNTTPVSISHPHAQTAVLLASFNHPDQPWINRMLEVSGTPRRLYTLARVLRATQMVDEMTEMDHQARLDAINAAHPAIVRKAA
jgi:hypothetical protein